MQIYPVVNLLRSSPRDSASSLTNLFMFNLMGIRCLSPTIKLKGGENNGIQNSA